MNNKFDQDPNFPQSIVTVTGGKFPEMNSEDKVKFNPKNISVLPVKGIVPFPEIPIPVQLVTNYSKLLCKEFEGKNEGIFLTPMSSDNKTENNIEIPAYGVIGRVMKVMELPGGERTALIAGFYRAKLTETVNYEPFISGKVQILEDKISKKDLAEANVTFDLIEEKFEQFVKEFDEGDPNSPFQFAFKQQEDRIQKFNFIAMNAPLSAEDKLQALKEDNVLKRARIILRGLMQTEKLFELRRQIFEKTNFEISQQQKEHFLQSQIRHIKDELGGISDDDDVDKLRQRAERMNWGESMQQFFEKELLKLTRFNVNSPDYSIQYGYLDSLLSLPWNNLKENDIDLIKLSQDLDKDHFGLEKVKERIIEHIAVLKLRKDMRSPILCIYGPPGVGKTSLCKSIADSIGRDYARVSLGGLHDEAEIRGHRKTYIGAMPGRIISAISKCSSSNPVFVLDEIDKIGKDYKGDPSQALLEVLDPEQNSTFHDNYLDVDYDLSKVFFIATANTISTISSPLLDRMELIDVSGYILEEKVEIAKRHLIPKLLVDHGFKKNEIKFDDEAIQIIICSYTRESGVRQLEKKISKVLRKIAVKKASGQKFSKTINAKKVKELLGKEEVIRDQYEGNDKIGVVTGLAWTAAGGEVLFVESTLADGKGNLSITGNLGDVMKESAQLAYQWIKSNAPAIGINAKDFSKKDVHIHVPEGAVPKDGPSAGITLVTSLASTFTNRKVRPNIAMTGEITLRGKVLPVGGIKEKILAAKRAGITKIILSKENQRDIEEIKEIYIRGLEIIYVEDIMEVLDNALC